MLWSINWATTKGRASSIFILSWTLSKRSSIAPTQLTKEIASHGNDEIRSNSFEIRSFLDSYNSNRNTYWPQKNTLPYVIQPRKIYEELKWHHSRIILHKINFKKHVLHDITLMSDRFNFPNCCVLLLHDNIVYCYSTPVWSAPTTWKHDFAVKHREWQFSVQFWRS